MRGEGGDDVGGGVAEGDHGIAVAGVADEGEGAGDGEGGVGEGGGGGGN
ncbi:hypothetical protein AGMMS49936_01580 [Endomicrobiia bacterium]|nr:hypothetical protein AGMMS49936_01580 [Endomicrobiia bacterium]